MIKSKQFIKDWVIPISAAIIIALLIRQFLFFTIDVPSCSMDPTIKIGDHIEVTKIYNYKNIKRGDVIVFNSKELKERLIKRVIGLPNETVEVKPDGTVLVNNQKINEPYVKNNGGKSGTYKVPKGKYFFMGDNRSNSYDSRYWNEPYIGTSDIIGKARFIYFPFSRIGKSLSPKKNIN